MSHVHLKIYNNDSTINQCYRISPRRNNNNFNINDYVKNSNNLYGIIKDKNDHYIIINWNDNTYERLQVPLINKHYLIRISKKEYTDNINNSVNMNYVDTIESQVSPLQTSTINTAAISSLQQVNNTVEEVQTNDISTENSIVDNSIVDNRLIENNTKTAQFNNKITNNKIKDLINIALNKGIIDPDEVETESLKLEAFDDKALKQYEEMLNNTLDDEGEVTSLSESQVDTSGLSPQEAEAHNMLHKLKHQRGISTSAKSKNININNASSRSLQDMEKTAITYMNTNNGQTINNSQISLDDSLLQALGDSNYQNDDNHQSNNNFSNIEDNDFNANINMNNFHINNVNDSNTNTNNVDKMSLDSIVEQIQQDNKSSFLKTPFNGLTKPLLINNSDNINPVNVAFKDLFSPDMFTYMGKR